MISTKFILFFRIGTRSVTSGMFCHRLSGFITILLYDTPHLSVPTAVFPLQFDHSESIIEKIHVVDTAKSS